MTRGPCQQKRAVGVGINGTSFDHFLPLWQILRLVWQFFLNIRQIFIAADGQILNTNNLAIYGHTGLGIPLIHPSCKSVGTP